MFTLFAVSWVGGWGYGMYRYPERFANINARFSSTKVLSPDCLCYRAGWELSGWPWQEFPLVADCYGSFWVERLFSFECIAAPGAFLPTTGKAIPCFAKDDPMWEIQSTRSTTTVSSSKCSVPA